MNAACSPNDAQIVPRRTNSQPRARATGTRPANATNACWNASPALSPGDRDDVGEGEHERAQDDARDDAATADPGRRGEAPEQDLLAERRDDARPASSDRAKPIASRSVAAG